VEADVCVWCYALLVVHARKEEEKDLFCNRTFVNKQHRSDVLPVTQPTVSKYRRNQKAPTPTTGLASSSLHPQPAS